MAKPQVVVAPVLMSKLSANAPEFYPSGYSNYTVRTASPAARGTYERPESVVLNSSACWRFLDCTQRQERVEPERKQNRLGSVLCSYVQGIRMEA